MLLISSRKIAAAVGGLETSGPIRDRSGEGPADVAKQFTLEQTLAQRSTIDSHKGSAPPQAQAMNGGRDEFLSGAGLAEQQDGGTRSSDTANGAVHVLHGRAGADQRGNRRPRFVV